MQKIIGNAFSLNMLSTPNGVLTLRTISLEEAQALVNEGGWQSAVGHQDTAALFQNQLGAPVAFNRATVKLSGGDQVLVGQLAGPRLPEGSTTLPEGATLTWVLVTV